MFDCQKIEKLRRQKKVSQKELCSLIEFTETGYQKAIQNNDLKVSTLLNIASVLGVPVNYFFEESEKLPDNITLVHNGSGNNNNIHNSNDVKEIEYLKEIINLLKEKIKKLEEK